MRRIRLRNKCIGSKTDHIKKFENHPSIKVVKSTKKGEQTILLIMFLMKKFLTKLGNSKL